MTNDAIWPERPLLTEEAEGLRRERDELREQLRAHAGDYRRGFKAGWDWSVSLRGDAPARELEEQRLVAAGLANELALVRAAADGDARRAEAIAQVAALLRELDRQTCTTFDGHAVRRAIAILEGVERG